MASVDLGNFLDKAHEEKSLDEIMKLPVHCLQGVTAKDGELLAEALGIRTIRDMGENKFFRMAQSMVQMAEIGAKG
jgi:hypothetical protein